MYGMYGYGYGYGLDPTIILVLIGVALSLWAQGRVNSTFSRYSRVRSMTGMTGAEAARRLLNAQGIYDVTVQQIAGELTDHYDPRTKTVNLSQSVYGATSVAAIGVAAHECGHAMQDNEGYAPLRFRSALVPVANFGSSLSWPLILLGLVFGGLGSPLVEIGILMFSGGAVPACDTSGGVQCVCPCGKTSGCAGHSRGRGSKRNEKSTERGGTDLRGGSSNFDPAASPSHYSLWRKKQT